MSVLNKIQKRKSSEVELDGEIVHIRSLNYFHGLEMHGLDDPGLVASFAVGSALLEEDGTLAIPRNDGESAKEFAVRVRQKLSDVTGDSIKTLMNAITKLSKPPGLETVSKNSEETDSPAS